MASLKRRREVAWPSDDAHFGFMSGWLHDLAEAFTRLRRRPMQSAVVAVVLTIGLSAATSAFGYIHAFSRPFPGVESEGLVRIFEMDEDEGYRDVSFLDYLDYRKAGSIQDLAVAQPYYAASVRLESMTEVAFIEAVTGNLFPMAQIQTVEGRGLQVGDDELSADPVAVISSVWWQTLFGSDPGVIGTTIYLNYRPFTVVGVASPAFRGTVSDARPDVWIPIAHFRDRYVGWDRSAQDRDVPLARTYGRLAPRTSRTQAEAELAGIALGLDEDYPRPEVARAVRLEDATWIDPRTRQAESGTLGMIVVAAAGLLLLVCANVANLLLALSAGRRQEVAVRAALGASPTRLLRQDLLENVILALVAGFVSFSLAVPISSRLGSYFARPSVWAETVPRETAIDGTVFGFALLGAVLAGILAGLVPALQSRRVDLVSALKVGTSDDSRGVRRLGDLKLPGAQDLLVTTQVALSVILLVVAGLVLQTFASVGEVHPGFAYEGLISSHVSTSSTDIDPGDRGRFFEELSARLQDEPWVRSVAVKDNALLSGQPTADVRLEGQSDPVTIITSRVIPGFFEALGIDVISGRPFTVADSGSVSEVAILNRSAAERYFGGGEAVGRRLWWPLQDGAETREFEVVGVTADVRARDVLVAPEPSVFFSYSQHPFPSGSALHIVTEGAPAPLVPRVQRWLREYEPHLAIVNVLPYTAVVDGSLYAQKMNAEMFSVLASLALALAAFGIFSVLSLSVRRRTREIGIRMAVGAGQGNIRHLMMGRAMRPVLAGLAVGLAGALSAREVIRGLLFGVEPWDPATLFGGAGVLMVVALAACYLPIRRATRVNPVEALKDGRL